MSFRPVVCVPTYDNEKTIGTVVAALIERGHTVLAVNDGSTDATEDRAKDAGAMIARHPTNKGKGEALKTALRWAQGNGYSHVLTIDGDGQHEPDDAPRLLDAAEKNPLAIVLGVRDVQRMPRKNRFGNEFSNFWVNMAMGSRFRDTQCGFRVYPADLLAQQRFRGRGYEFETEALIRHARNKQPIVPVDVQVYYPEERVSHFKPWRDATRIVLLVMRFLFLPRFLWALLPLVLFACAARVESVRPAASTSEQKARALSQTGRRFSASQHLRYQDGKETREANALFIVYPGEGFRMRVLGPMFVTVFDVSVRCGRYAIEAGDKRNGGALSDADQSFFPVRELERALRPIGAGSWHGDTFVSDDGVKARLDKDSELFNEIDAGSGMRVRVLESMRVDGVMMPKRVRVELSEGRALEIENTELGFDAPGPESALANVVCEG